MVDHQDLELLELWLIGGLDHHSPLGSSACLASLRRAAANPEFADWATAFPLVSGLRGLTVAVLRVAVEIIPKDGDLLDSWFIPEVKRGHGQSVSVRVSKKKKTYRVILSEKASTSQYSWSNIHLE